MSKTKKAVEANLEQKKNPIQLFQCQKLLLTTKNLRDFSFPMMERDTDISLKITFLFIEEKDSKLFFLILSNMTIHLPKSQK